VVSKVRDSRYPAGRGNDCVKKTCAQRETLPIAGFSLKVNKFDGIYLGRLRAMTLVCAGKVDHGFDKSSTAELQARLKPLIRKTQPTPRRSRIAASGSSRRRATRLRPTLLHCSEARPTPPFANRPNVIVAKSSRNRVGRASNGCLLGTLMATYDYRSAITEDSMNGLIYLVGLVVVILAVLSFFGLR
jgi:hypothetical protein